jgi:predicted glutamine amidotransferase
MCIICVKPQGAKLPDDKTIETMYKNNPDGAGFMFARNGKVEIRKGFMTYADFRHELDKACKAGAGDGSLVMHFRITTHGGTCQQNTHPFPLSSDIGELRSLYTTCDIGVAHNGIIKIKTRDKSVSDTQEFIASVLTPVYNSDHKFYESERIREAILDCINGSRMVFLEGDGQVQMIGSWIEDGGCYYSNDTYKLYNSRWLAWLEALDYGESTPSKHKRSREDKREDDSEKESHTRKSVRLPWERDARLYVNLMELGQNDIVLGEDGKQYLGIYHAIDKGNRVYFIDPENYYAYETYDRVTGNVKFDKRKAEYYELM